MRRILILAILLCVTASSWAQFRRRDRGTQQATESGLNYANPKEYTIAGIEISGINVLDKNAMISISGLKIGDKIKIPGEAITGAGSMVWLAMCQLKCNE
jgi:outer membrane protein insertion porin family